MSQDVKKSKMPFAEYVEQAMIDVWASVIGTEIHVGPGPRAWSGGGFTGHVDVVGDWNGAVTIKCSTALAFKIGRRIYCSEIEYLDIRDVENAVANLTKTIAESISVLFAARSSLSEAVGTEGANKKGAAPERLISEVVFESEGEPIVVALLEQ